MINYLHNFCKESIATGKIVPLFFNYNPNSRDGNEL
jgi:hypothetical protein